MNIKKKSNSAKRGSASRTLAKGKKIIKKSKLKQSGKYRVYEVKK